MLGGASCIRVSAKHLGRAALEHIGRSFFAVVIAVGQVLCSAPSQQLHGNMPSILPKVQQLVVTESEGTVPGQFSCTARLTLRVGLGLLGALEVQNAMQV